MGREPDPVFNEEEQRALARKALEGITPDELRSTLRNLRATLIVTEAAHSSARHLLGKYPDEQLRVVQVALEEAEALWLQLIRRHPPSL